MHSFPPELNPGATETATALGWTVLRASAADVLRNPDRFAAQVRAVLHQRAA